MTVINTNVKSLQAQNSLVANNRIMTTTMQQLSTGKRINTAGDDAAGLAIVSKMTAQIRGLDQAVRNANDGISLLQTAEGALIEVTNMLQRMRELAVQSATDTNTVTDRGYLNDEFQQLKTEIDRIARNTQWNGMNILNGNNDFGTAVGALQEVAFQVGANADQTIKVNFKDFSFTPSTSGASASKTEINFASMTDGLVASRIKFNVNTGSGTYNSQTNTWSSTTTQNFDIDISTIASGTNPDTNLIQTIAGELNTQLKQYAGFESVSVTSSGEVITINDPSGREFAAFTFALQDGSAVSPTGGISVTPTAGVQSGGVAPVGGAFTSTLAGAVITTRDASNTSIQALDVALKSVNDERSKFGAVINRLNYSVDNLTNISQNTSASRSRVLDADYAKASAELARTQIISQAATAMLAQANQQPQAVLQLLQG